MTEESPWSNQLNWVSLWSGAIGVRKRVFRRMSDGERESNKRGFHRRASNLSRDQVGGDRGAWGVWWKKTGT